MAIPYIIDHFGHFVNIEKNEKKFKKGLDKAFVKWYNDKAVAWDSNDWSLKIEQQRAKYKA